MKKNTDDNPLTKSRNVIIGGFVAVLLVFCVVLIVWFTTSRQEYTRLIIIDEYRQAAEYLGDMRKAALHRSVLLHEMTLLQDPFYLDEKYQEFSNEAGSYMFARENYLSLTMLDGDTELWDRIEIKVRKNSSAQRNVAKLIQEGEIKLARKILYEILVPEQRNILALLSEMLEQQNRLVSNELNEANRVKKRNDFIIQGLAFITILFTIGIIIFVVRTTLRIQKDLRKADEARVANKMKSKFISSMSHELRTPLNAILGFGQLLELQIGNISHEKSKQYIDDILRAGHHLLELINEVLDLSRVESGHLDIKPESIQLTAIIKECIDQINTGMVRQGSITVVNEVDDTELFVIADQKRLRQVLINLLSNAVKYNREDGIVRVKAEMLDKKQLRIIVSDTGKGINAADIEKLFDPFERLTFKNSNVEGTGIGLTVTKQLVEAMGGTIGVDSVTDQGSVFWVEFPLAVSVSGST